MFLGNQIRNDLSPTELEPYYAWVYAFHFVTLWNKRYEVTAFRKQCNGVDPDPRSPGGKLSADTAFVATNPVMVIPTISFEFFLLRIHIVKKSSGTLSMNSRSLSLPLSR